MLTIYGSPRSSAGRVFWCLEEIGLTYKVEPIDFQKKEHESPAFKALNPNAKVPLLKDEDFVIWESMAINTYLAERYMPELLGPDANTKGLVQQWSFWAATELQVPIIEVFIQKKFVPEEKRSQKIIEENEKKIPPLLTILNNELLKNRFLAHSQFTLADLHVASVVSILEPIAFSLGSYPHVQQWLGVINERPGYQRYQGLRK
jgi:glutathione S-transferase